MRPNLLVLPADILDRDSLNVLDLLDKGSDEAPRPVAVGDSVLLASSSLKDDNIVLDSSGITSIFKNVLGRLIRTYPMTVFQ